MRRRDPSAVGRAITAAQRGGKAYRRPVGKPRALRVGFTGPPGAGKSSLLREVMKRLRSQGDAAALVACDPVSPVTGGSFLGDRCRFAGLSEDPGLFIRSVAHRSPPGELPPEALKAADVLEAAGFPWIFIETVGSGQAEVDGLRGTDLRVLVHPPDAGDGMQMLKAGAIETADLHAVNKCDRPGAAVLARELRIALGTVAGEAGAPVFEVSALTGQGVDALVAELRMRRDTPGKERLP